MCLGKTKQKYVGNATNISARNVQLAVAPFLAYRGKGFIIIRIGDEVDLPILGFSSLLLGGQDNVFYLANQSD